MNDLIIMIFIIMIIIALLYWYDSKKEYEDKDIELRLLNQSVNLTDNIVCIIDLYFWQKKKLKLVKDTYKQNTIITREDGYKYKILNCEYIYSPNNIQLPLLNMVEIQIRITAKACIEYEDRVYTSIYQNIGVNKGTVNAAGGNIKSNNSISHNEIEKINLLVLEIRRIIEDWCIDENLKVEIIDDLEIITEEISMGIHKIVRLKKAYNRVVLLKDFGETNITYKVETLGRLLENFI